MNHTHIETDRFGVTADGLAVDRYRLRNAAGAAVSVITYGATVTELWMPDRDGKFDDVVLGFDELAQYETQGPYFGCTVGRVAFRITEGQFTLDGRSYQLTRNAGKHHLHGGVRGLSQVVWQAEPLPGAAAVRLRYRSPDGDQGYPGQLDVSVTYTLTNDNDLRIDYLATTDHPTPVDLTHHGYFNLRGAGCGDVLEHVLQLAADRYCPTDAALIPTGEIVSVRGTPLDFTTPTPLGARIVEAGGYDLSYLRNERGASLSRVAVLDEPRSGRRLEVVATAPAMILYTGNYLDGTLRGKGGIAYGRHAGVCLEAGHLPDSVRHPNFPSIVLRPGQSYCHTCLYGFRVRATA